MARVILHRGALLAAIPLLLLDTLLRLRSNQSDLLRAILQVPAGAGGRRPRCARRWLHTTFQRRTCQPVRLPTLAAGLQRGRTAAGDYRRGLHRYRSASERKRLHLLVEEKTRELNELATRDDLTRVHNRRHLGELLAQQLALHARSGAPMCIALLDIDLFKAINDRWGHAAGDAVLQRFAATVRQTPRTVDLLGRWGGEEFLVALPQTSIAQAEQALLRIREALANADFSDIASGLRVTFSGGLVSLGADATPGSDETIAAAVERADQAMYRAKTQGRDRVEKG